MRVMDSDSFNNKIWNQIEKIKYIIEHQITPENIKYFDGDLIRQARDLLASDTYLKIDWTQNNNVNSYEMSKVRQMIDYLKTSQTETLLFEDQIDVRNFGTSGASALPYVNGSVSVNIPHNFDGRNSFWFTSLISGKNSNLIMTKNDFVNLYLNTTDEKGASLTIARNKHEVKLSVKFSQSGVYTPLELANSYVRLFGIVWRTI